MFQLQVVRAGEVPSPLTVSCSCDYLLTLTCQLQVVRAGEVPPPSTVGCSCVYVVRRGDGRFYGGQTDDLKGRLNTHRKRLPIKGGAKLEAAYLIMPFSGQGQSTAKVVEAQVIQVLPVIPVTRVTPAVDTMGTDVSATRPTKSCSANEGHNQVGFSKAGQSTIRVMHFISKIVFGPTGRKFDIRPLTLELSSVIPQGIQGTTLRVRIWT